MQHIEIYLRMFINTIMPVIFLIVQWIGNIFVKWIVNIEQVTATRVTLLKCKSDHVTLLFKAL